MCGMAWRGAAAGPGSWSASSGYGLRMGLRRRVGWRRAGAPEQLARDLLRLHPARLQQHEQMIERGRRPRRPGRAALGGHRSGGHGGDRRDSGLDPLLPHLLGDALDPAGEQPGGVARRPGRRPAGTRARRRASPAPGGRDWARSSCACRGGRWDRRAGRAPAGRRRRSRRSPRPPRSMLPEVSPFARGLP